MSYLPHRAYNLDVETGLWTATSGHHGLLSVTDYRDLISLGLVANHVTFRVLGYNADVDNVTEDVWDVGGEYVLPTAGMQMELVSSAAADSSASTGIRSVDVHYLDSSYVTQNEVVVLNGVTPVTTVATNILRIQQIHAQTVGTGGVAAGNIDIRHLADTPIYARIATGRNVSTGAIWTVPAGKVAHISKWKVSVGNSTGGRFGQFFLKAETNFEGTLNAGIFQEHDIIGQQDSGSSINLVSLLKLPATCTIKVSAISDSAASNAICTASVEGWYEPA